MADREMVVRIGHKEVVLRQRYEAASILNDVLIALWFAVGSILFFSQSEMTLGTWFFLAGSVELLIRPVIRFTRLIHLRRLHGSGTSQSDGAAQAPSDAPDY